MHNKFSRWREIGRKAMHFESNISSNSNKKMWWICNEGHEWQDTPNHRSHGRGCPYCSGHRVLKGYNDLATTHPSLIFEWNTARNDLTPQQVSAGSNRHVWWICNEGHEWKDTVVHRVTDRGCPYCSGRRLLVGFNDLATTHPRLAKEWHPSKNENLTPQMLTKGSNKSVWWVCWRCKHEWKTTVNHRTSSYKETGCPNCAGKVKEE